MRLGIRAAKIRVRLMNEAPGGIKRGVGAVEQAGQNYLKLYQVPAFNFMRGPEYGNLPSRGGVARSKRDLDR